MAHPVHQLEQRRRLGRHDAPRDHLQILTALVAITPASAQEPAMTQTRERVVSYFRRYADGMAFSGTVLVAKSGAPQLNCRR